MIVVLPASILTLIQQKRRLVASSGAKMNLGWPDANRIVWARQASPENGHVFEISGVPWMLKSERCTRNLREKCEN